MTLGEDGDATADGVMSALHEVGGLQHHLTLFLQLVQQQFAVLQTS